jgi:hypothetical protein
VGGILNASRLCVLPVVAIQPTDSLQSACSSGLVLVQEVRFSSRLPPGRGLFSRSGSEQLLQRTWWHRVAIRDSLS